MGKNCQYQTLFIFSFTHPFTASSSVSFASPPLPFVSLFCPEGPLPKSSKEIWMTSVSSHSRSGWNPADKQCLTYSELKIKFTVIALLQFSNNQLYILTLNGHMTYWYSTISHKTSGSTVSIWPRKCRYGTPSQFQPCFLDNLYITDYWWLARPTAV